MPKKIAPDLKPVHGNLQATQTAFICGWKISGSYIHLNRWNQKRRNPQRGIAGCTHVDKGFHVACVTHVNVRLPLLRDRGDP